MNVIPENIKTRISKNGKLRVQLKNMKQIVKDNPESDYARSVLSQFRKKFWFGARYISYSDMHNEAWSKFELNNDIFEFSGYRFNNDAAIYFDFTGIVLSDRIYKLSLDNLNNDQKIAAQILGVLSTSEGPYSTENIYIKEDDIVIDAGANMGIFSIFAAKQNVDRIYAFEPQNKVVDILRKNIVLNSMENKISAISYGLSDTNTDVKLNHPTNGHTAASIILPLNNTEDFEIIHCVTLDDWVIDNNIKKIDFIKADIEGAERNMLMGARNVLKNFSPKLSICTYHLKDDPDVLKKIILEANEDYELSFTTHKLFGYVPDKTTRN